MTKEDYGPYQFIGYRSQITDFLDKNIKTPSQYFYNYMLKHDDVWVFRYMGATRGSIVVDGKNIITAINLYENSAEIYNEETYAGLQEYIGKRLILEDKPIK